MGTLISLVLMILSCPILAQAIKSSHLLDLLIRDYTLKSLNTTLPTGSPSSVDLPANLSGIRVNTVRFRCGSLRRYGARLDEFRLGAGVTAQPCAERVVIVTQSFERDWSDLYYRNYNLSGYRLVSPVLGLLAYNAAAGAPFEVGLLAREGEPIRVDFTAAKVNATAALCVSFESDGKWGLAKQAKPYICTARRNGHFGLVIPETPSRAARLPDNGDRPWRVAVGSSVGAALAALLIGLLLVAMLVRVKKRSRMDELERRAYEEEALQVSMVGHVRAPTARGTRTAPTSVESECVS